MKENKNYVGITGITSVAEAVTIAFKFKESGFPTKTHDAMIGLLVSPRNLEPDWYSTRYPSLGEYPKILKAIQSVDTNLFKTLHIDEKNTSNWRNDLGELVRTIGPSLIDGVQINVMHPHPMDLCVIKRAFPHLRIIMQYSSDFFDLDIDDAMREVRPYIKNVSHILIDPSRGRGLKIDPKVACEHYAKLRQIYPDTCVGFAGGFSPDNISTYLVKFQEVAGNTKFSLDIESGVRDEDDRLVMKKASDYISTSSDFLAVGKRDGGRIRKGI